MKRWRISVGGAVRSVTRFMRGRGDAIEMTLERARPYRLGLGDGLVENGATVDRNPNPIPTDCANLCRRHASGRGQPQQVCRRLGGRGDDHPRRGFAKQRGDVGDRRITDSGNIN